MRNFRKSDKDAIIILLVVIIICMVALPLLRSSEDKEKSPNKMEYANKPRQYTRKQPYYKVPELFYFDPNTADSTQLLRLGLQPWQVRNIYKYRAAGGRYNKPTDFARLYGLTLKQYKRLEPYIRIEKEVMAADVYKSSQNVSVNDTTVKKDSALIGYYTKIKEGEQIDINTADTSELKHIPGIGSYYAKRIVSFRQRLGGIANVHQLLEIQGFPESSLKYMTTGQSASTRQLPITRIRINHLDVNNLSRHPYIRYVQAKEIMNHRRLRGPIKKADDLRRLPSFTDKEVERLEPYIDYSP